MSSKFNYENLNNLRILSLKDAIENNFETWYASVCRWYSRNFYTPLVKVEEMAPEVILKTYYDDIYYKLATSNEKESRDHIEREVKAIIYSKNKTTKDIEQELEEEQADEEWYQEELRKINEQIAKEGVNPNLIDTQKDKEFVEFEDTPPDFEDEN